MPADVSDLRRLARDLRRGAAGMELLVQKVVAKTALDIEADAKRLAPVDTGALRNSIGHDLTEDKLGAEVGPTVDYAEYVEFGTSRQAPQPYLHPAADRRLPAFEKALENILDRLT
ncbi:HK97 gp10 family phage protein [Desertihabitans brevis]|uniref:HK97 gp10 family phage protein n=1 Tax=Desertihabitans brevis TaxID=2268447 RepID=A0A367YR52_9ACTN|nr:HK97-gp10 family putative phage morphogenesis protein [Desertihabitans brevis]RCK68270.1 HK97 gp10 family phage protein [Desertihabitans brevis]